MSGVSESYLLKLADSICWSSKLYSLGCELGFSYNRVSQYKAQNYRSEDGTLQMLMDWKQSCARKNQVAKLNDALQKSELGAYCIKEKDTKLATEEQAKNMEATRVQREAQDLVDTHEFKQSLFQKVIPLLNNQEDLQLAIYWCVANSIYGVDSSTTSWSELLARLDKDLSYQSNTLEQIIELTGNEEALREYKRIVASLDTHKLDGAIKIVASKMGHLWPLFIDSLATARCSPDVLKASIKEKHPDDVFQQCKEAVGMWARDQRGRDIIDLVRLLVRSEHKGSQPVAETLKTLAKHKRGWLIQ